jgi:hypothetical protein
LRRTAFAAALVAALALGVVALADRETAAFSSGRADKSLAAKKYEEAESLYRKALEEDATYLPARYGLAQALVGGGKSGVAVEELRKLVADAHADTALPAEWKPMVAKAEKQLGDLDAAGAALQKIVDGYADALVDLAQRWMTKDSSVAERALRRALKIRPGMPRATELLEKMGKSAAAETVDLFNGTDLTGWEFAHVPTTQAIDGELVLNVKDQGITIRSEASFEGSFDVRMEAKVVESYAGLSVCELLPCWKGDFDHYNLGVEDDSVMFLEQLGDSSKDRKIWSALHRNMKKPFDPKDWHTYEVRLRGLEAVALIDGEVVAKDTRPESRRGGFVGILVQNARVAIRKIQVDRR